MELMTACFPLQMPAPRSDRSASPDWKPVQDESQNLFSHQLAKKQNMIKLANL